MNEEGDYIDKGIDQVEDRNGRMLEMEGSSFDNKFRRSEHTDGDPADGTEILPT